MSAREQRQRRANRRAAGHARRAAHGASTRQKVAVHCAILRAVEAAIAMAYESGKRDGTRGWCAQPPRPETMEAEMITTATAAAQRAYIETMEAF